jgi:hypothetical protein
MTFVRKEIFGLSLLNKSESKNFPVKNDPDFSFSNHTMKLKNSSLADFFFCGKAIKRRIDLFSSVSHL